MGTYNWSTVDKNKCVSAGVTMTANGVDITNSSFKVLNAGTVLVATAPAGKMFNPSVGGSVGDHPSIWLRLENPISGADKGVKYFTLSNNNKTATYTLEALDSSTDYMQGSLQVGVIDAVVTPLYTMTAADFTTLHDNGGLLYESDLDGNNLNPITAASPNIPRHTSSRALYIKLDPAYTFIPNATYFTDVNGGKVMFYTANLKPGYITASINSGTPDFASFTMAVKKPSVVTPLVWGNHPAQADQNTDVAYSWSGGDSAKGFVFQVLDATGANILDDVDIPAGTFSHTVNRISGDYIIRVFIEGEDHTPNADKLEQALKLIVPLPALVWGEHPASGKIGQDLKYTWTGGDTVNGYTVKVLHANGTEVLSVDVATGEYTFNQPTPEKYTVQVFNKGSSVVGLSQMVDIIEPPANYVFKQSDFDLLTASQITLKANGVEVSVGFKLFYGDKLEATCPTTREFFKSASDTPETSIYFEGENDFGTTGWLEFNIINPQLATVDFEPYSASMSGNYVLFNAHTRQFIDTKGSNHVYSLTQDQLDHLNNARFVASDVATTGYAVYDYGQFILGLIQLPFSLDPSYILQPESIRLATLDSKVMAPVVSTDKPRVDLGSIYTPRDTDTFLDYQNTTALLHLPRTEAINIGTEYVIGETITVEYIIDAYTGRATINIGSSKIGGDIIVSKEVDLGVNIPYTTLITTRSAENTSITLGGDNHVTTPYIEIVRYDTVLANGFWTVPVPDEDTLDAQTGFIQVQNIELVSGALRVEKQEIISLLTAGVIIK